MKNRTTVSEQFYNSNQSWHYDKIVKVGSNTQTLRVEIRRNAYNDQSYVRGMALDPVHRKWNTLIERPITTAKCRDASYIRDNERIEPFQADAESVIEELKNILL